MQAATTTTTSRSDQLQRPAGDLEDLSQLQNDVQTESGFQFEKETQEPAPPKVPSLQGHRWMSDERVLQMSEADQVLFAQHRFKQLPEFHADMDLDDIPPSHPLFQAEWD